MSDEKKEVNIEPTKEELEVQVENNKESVEKALNDGSKTPDVEYSNIHAGELMEKIKKDLKPTKISKTYSMSIKDRSELWRKFEATIEADVVDNNPKVTGRLLFDLVKQMVDEDAERVLSEK